MLGTQACGLFFGSEGTDGCSTSISPSAIATLVFTGSGDAAFKTYDTNKTNNDQLFPLGPADLTGPATGSTSVAPLSFYDGTAESLTVSCTASVTAPDGTSLSVSAKAPQITVLKPTATKWLIDTGNVHYNSSAGEYGLFPAFGTGAPGGVSWHDVTVTVPAPFSGGTCCFTQLATPNHTYNGTAQGNTNGVPGLDNSFAYANYTWSPPALGTNYDSPAITVPAGKAVGDVVTASDGLQAWLMYQPPGGVWVPLQKYSYSWALTLTWGSDGTWAMSGQNPPPPGAGPSYTGTDTSDPPQWSVVHTNGN